jgi:hypothetical protein
VTFLANNPSRGIVEYFTGEVEPIRLKTYCESFGELTQPVANWGLFTKTDNSDAVALVGYIYLNFQFVNDTFCCSVARGVKLTISNKIITRMGHLNVGFCARS